MAHTDNHFEEFRPHTKLKHQILRIYLYSWAFKLLQRKGSHDGKVFFVDAFAGAGRDAKGNPGSPAIATQVALEVNDHFAQKGQPKLRMEVVCIENNHHRFETLQQHMRAFDAADKVYRLLHGELLQHLRDLTQLAGRSPTLYFLDPFGIKGLDANTYGPMLSGQQNEVFILLSDNGAARHYGLVTANPDERIADLEAAKKAPLLFDDWQTEKEKELSEAARKYRETLEAQQPISRDILDHALGDPTLMKYIAKAPREKRARLFLGCFRDQLRHNGASHLISFPMRDDEDRHVYSLVHASRSSHGFAAMKEAISDGLKRCDLPEQVVERIRSDLSTPVEAIVDQLKKSFAGRTAYWVDDIQPHLQHFTPLFPFQRDEVKQVLNQRFDRVPGRKIAYVFDSQ